MRELRNPAILSHDMMQWSTKSGT
eukprot:COSAG02_NODE_18394_length_941_cov_1.998812_2_plen_23_part_01